MKYFFCIIIGYIFGTVNYAYIMGKIKGFDIRTKGSANAGASNATITMGWKIGVLVGFCDIAKAFIAIIIARLIFPELYFADVISGTACILGHIFPFYLKFRGGKGFASYMGMILALDWEFFLIMGTAIILITIITDYIALATLSTVVAYPVYLLFTNTDITIILVVAAASVIMIFKHIDNIKRILSGKELGLRTTRKKAKKMQSTYKASR